MIFQDIPRKLVKETAVGPVCCLQYTKPELFVHQKKPFPTVEGRYCNPNPLTDPGHRVRPEKVGAQDFQNETQGVGGIGDEHGW